MKDSIILFTRNNGFQVKFLKVGFQFGIKSFYYKKAELFNEVP